MFLCVFACNFQNKNWILTVLWLKHFAVTVFANVEWPVAQSRCSSPSIDSHQLSVILVLSLPLPYFVQGQGRQKREPKQTSATIAISFPVLCSHVCCSVIYFLSVDLSFSCFWNNSWTVPWWHDAGVLFWRHCPLHSAWWAGLQGSQGGWQCWCGVHGPVAGRTQRYACCLLSLWSQMCS